MAWIGIGVGGFVLLSYAGDLAPQGLHLPLVLLVLAMLALYTIRLVRVWRLPDVHLLMAAAGGHESVALISADRGQIYGLVGRVLGALGNPATHFTVKVENVYGNKVLGDMVGGDKILRDKIVH